MTDGRIPYNATYEPQAYTMWGGGEGGECVFSPQEGPSL